MTGLDSHLESISALPSEPTTTKTMIDPIFKAKWVAALRSGEYTQGTGNLYLQETDSYCCLGVCGLILGFTKQQMDRKSNPAIDHIYNDICPGLPKVEMDELIRMNDGGADRKYSFEEIADHIEKYL